MPDSTADRVYEVIEFLANEEQIAGGTVKVRGPFAGLSEAQCRVGNSPDLIWFDSGDLPEPDRIGLLESGVGGKPQRHGIVKLDCKSNPPRAKELNFED